MKSCTKCGEIKPMAAFYVQRHATRINIRAQCGACSVAENKQRRWKRNNEIRQAILALLTDHGAMTAQQMAGKTNHSPHVIGAQAREMANSGQICRTPHPHTTANHWIWHLHGQTADIKIARYARPKKTAIKAKPANKAKKKKPRIVSHDRWFIRLQAEVAARKKALQTIRARV